MKKKETNTTKKTTTKKPSNRSTFPKSKENEGKLIDLELKKISLLEKQKQIADADKNKIIENDFEHRRIKVNEDTIINSRLYYLTSIMTSLTIDTEKTILGSEPVYKSLFDEKEIHLIKAKFFETLKTL